MKRPIFYFLLSSFIVACFVREAKAQGTQDAVTPDSPINGGVYSSNIAGYLQGGVGWTFTPTENLLATGIYSTDNQPANPQVSFWLGTNQILTTFAYTNSFNSLERIIPFILLAGQNYAISEQNSNFTSAVNFFIVGQGQYTSSPNLTGITAYSLSTNGQWTTFPSFDGGIDVLLGPNFQFQVVPEPSSFDLLIVGLLFCVWRLNLNLRHDWLSK